MLHTMWQAAVASNVIAPPALSLEQVVEMQVGPGYMG